MTLLEREELAAGASGRNNGLWLTPVDPALLPMAKISLARYLEIADASPVPFRLDPEPIGLVAAALDDEEMSFGEQAHEPYRAAGVRVDRLEAADVLRLEPAISSQVLGGWLVASRSPAGARGADRGARPDGRGARRDRAAPPAGARRARGSGSGRWAS